MIVYFKDCPSIQDRTSKTHYTLSSLRKTYDEYYKCINSQPVYKIKTEKPVEFGLVAGVSLTKLKFKASAPAFIAGSIFPISVNFSTGIIVNIIIPRNFQRWSVYNELNLTSFKTSAEYIDFTHENNYTVINTTIGDYYVMFMSMIRYRYPIHKISIFINGGVSMGLAYAYTNQKTSTQYFYDQIRTRYGTAYDITRNYEVGLAAGLGIRYLHFTFEIRYDKPLYPGYSSPTNRFYFLLGYTF